MRTLRAKPPKTIKPSRPKIVVYGGPGVGKTWWALDFPGVYYLDTEAGADLNQYREKLHKAGGLYLGPSDGTTDFSFVIDEVITLATADHPHRTLVIDSFSKLYNTAIQIEYDRLAGEGRDMTKTFGAEKKPAIASTRRLITWFDRLDMNVILICHTRDKWVNGDVVGTTFDGWDRLEYELHLVLEVFMPSPSTRKVRVGKSRLEKFLQGDVFDWDYGEFTTRYGMDVITAAAGHIELADEAQVSRVEDLLEYVRLDSATKQAWWDKAGVSSWDEMPKETLQKCIDFLENPEMAK